MFVPAKGDGQGNYELKLIFRMSVEIGITVFLKALR